jgi:hypothetical protein
MISAFRDYLRTIVSVLSIFSNQAMVLLHFLTNYFVSNFYCAIDNCYFISRRYCMQLNGRAVTHRSQRYVLGKISPLRAAYAFLLCRKALKIRQEKRC